MTKRFRISKRVHPAHRMSQYGPDKPRIDNSNRMTQEARDRSDRWMAELEGGAALSSNIVERCGAALSSNIVERLRIVERAGDLPPRGHPSLAQEAADRIEQLEAGVNLWRDRCESMQRDFDASLAQPCHVCGAKP